MATDLTFSRLRQTLWESGSLRCISMATKGHTSFAVYVFNGDSLACMEPCNSADEAAVLAERMRKLFVDIGRRSHGR
jgi:hypothetical protein